MLGSGLRQLQNYFIEFFKKLISVRIDYIVYPD